MVKKKEAYIYKSKLGMLIQVNSIKLLDNDDETATLKVKLN